LVSKQEGEEELPGEDAIEKERLISEIKSAFAGVDRQGGVSWRAAQIADFWGDESQADYVDSDSSWEDLVDDRNWNPDSGDGGWAFLDAVGFRYYIPAGMLRAIRDSLDLSFLFAFPKAGDLENYRLKQWSLLDLRQRRAIAYFLLYMDAQLRAAMAEITEGDEVLSWPVWPENKTTPWMRAYRNYWHQFA
jgi:hypothetical protein